MADKFEVMKLWVPLKLKYYSSRPEDIKLGGIYTVTCSY
jgi:hypothetical protein